MPDTTYSIAECIQWEVKKVEIVDTDTFIFYLFPGCKIDVVALFKLYENL